MKILTFLVKMPETLNCEKIQAYRRCRWIVRGDDKGAGWVKGVAWTEGFALGSELFAQCV